MSNQSAQKYTSELLTSLKSLCEQHGRGMWLEITRGFCSARDETLRRYEGHELDALAERALVAPEWAAFEVPECERVVYVGDRENIDGKLN